MAEFHAVFFRTAARLIGKRLPLVASVTCGGSIPRPIPPKTSSLLAHGIHLVWTEPQSIVVAEDAIIARRTASDAVHQDELTRLQRSTRT